MSELEGKFEEALKIVEHLHCLNSPVFGLTVWEWTKRNISIPRAILAKRWASQPVMSMKEVAVWYRNFIDIRLRQKDVSDHYARTKRWMVSVTESRAKKPKLKRLENPSLDDELVVLFVFLLFYDRVISFDYSIQRQRRKRIVTKSYGNNYLRNLEEVQDCLIKLASGLSIIQVLEFYSQLTIHWIMTLPKNDIRFRFKRLGRLSDREFSALVLNHFSDYFSYYPGIEDERYFPYFFPDIESHELIEFGDSPVN